MICILLYPVVRIIFPNNLAVAEGINLRRSLKQNRERFPVCLRTAAYVRAAYEPSGWAPRTSLKMRILKDSVRKAAQERNGGQRDPETRRDPETQPRRGKPLLESRQTGSFGRRSFRSRLSLKNMAK